MNYNDYINFDDYLPNITINEIFDETTEKGVEKYYDKIVDAYKTTPRVIQYINPEDNSHCEVLCKVTSFCNQNCIYCFDVNNDHKKHNTLTKEQIVKLFDLLSNKHHEISWIWHGGECLSVDIDWFDDVMLTLQKIAYVKRTEVNFTIQTNLSLINEKWIKLLDKYNISIGVSYDWTAQKIRGYSLTREQRDLFNYSICVVTKYNINDLIKIYQQNKDENKTCFSFNFIFANHGKSPDYYLDIHEGISKFKDFIEFYLYDQSNITERTTISLIELVLNRNASVCNLGNCILTNRVCINSDGTLWICDNTNFKELYICDLADINSIDEFYHHPNRENIKKFREAQTKPECDTCNIRDICGKGCIHCTLFESGGKEPYSMNCELLKQLVPFLYEKLGNLTPADFMKLNPIVKKKLIEGMYLPAYKKEELKEYYENNNIQTYVQM